MGRARTYYDQVLDASMTCRSRKEMAEKTGLKVSTINAYYRDPKFQAMLRERKKEIIGNATSLMQANMCKSVEVLSSIIRDITINPAIRIQAVSVMLNNAKVFTDMYEVVDRVAYLEKTVIMLTEHNSQDCIDVGGGD